MYCHLTDFPHSKHWPRAELDSLPEYWLKKGLQKHLRNNHISVSDGHEY